MLGAGLKALAAGLALTVRPGPGVVDLEAPEVDLLTKS
jgi:hypothetical protein